MATRFAFVDDSGETRLAGFIVPEPGGGSVPANYLLANQDGPATLTGTQENVLWTINLDSGAGYFELNVDGFTWDCLVAGSYVINAEPKFTFTKSDGDLFVAVANVQLRPTFADGNAYGYYLNLLWDYLFVSGANASRAFYQSYITPPLQFAAGDSFLVQANITDTVEGTGEIISESAHSLSVVRVA